MPKPPILPVLDWESIWTSGLSFELWLEQAEPPENKQRIIDALNTPMLESQERGMLAALPRAVHVLAIAEAWCGDVVRQVPVLAYMAKIAPNVQVRYISRMQHPDVFVRFLTYGGESVPKFIFLSENWVECGCWGPMPSTCLALMARGKACNNIAAARQKISALYATDATKRETVRELLQCIETAVAETP